MRLSQVSGTLLVSDVCTSGDPAYVFAPLRMGRVRAQLRVRRAEVCRCAGREMLRPGPDVRCRLLLAGAACGGVSGDRDFAFVCVPPSETCALGMRSSMRQREFQICRASNPSMNS
ncbi:hypothetical protein DICSQDRAFT_156293 [Dichomitus squalens LYAD-421 SS1]|uniref:Uncharacterized protein n=1 Tax=Dichomitus squalens (strain LYAD-421) TaxID=732165 RepID=R7SU61_DICSQ|nr:uncharacterized protein DICSQDRAFT_156293 [Dichomitus squalens LYAD-421 SS1]EJF59458.1 hypothetical protein DICSQDRAFT_156293 [Dichomitus squalens LYAD-421 SS1]